MLQGAHDGLADAFQVFVQRMADGLRLWQHRSGQGGHLDGHHRVVGFAQALEARHLVGRRQAQADQLLVGRRGDVALQPLGAGHEPLEAQHLAEPRQARQRLFQAGGDKGAGALTAADQALGKQDFQGFTGGDPRDAQLLAEGALGGQGLFGFPLAGVNCRFQIACQLQVQRRGLFVVGTQRQDGVHLSGFRCGYWCVVAR